MKYENKHMVLEFVLSLSDGGAETLVKDYALLLDRNRFDVAVVTLFPIEDTANARSLMENSVKIYPIMKQKRFVDRVLKRLFIKQVISNRLLEIVRMTNAEILHIHLALLKYVAPISDDLCGVRLFYTCHSLPEIYLGIRNKKENTAAKLLIKNNGLRMIALHSEMAREINEMMGIDNTFVVHNGINAEQFRHVAESREQVRERIGIPADAFVVGHVGRFDAVKNHPFIVDIFVCIFRQNPNAYLLLVGAGSEKRVSLVRQKIIENQIEDHVMILSHRRDVPQLMKAMDLFLFPSLHEGFGTALIEAQAAGVRCVASDALPECAFVSENALRMPLRVSAQDWCDAAIDKNRKGDKKSDLDEFDIKDIIRRIESIYLGETV